MERERKSRKRQRKALKHNDSELQREKDGQKDELRDRQRLTYRDIETQRKGREGTRNALV
jgi:hypothetical protein